MDSGAIFEAILSNELLPAFCSHPTGQYEVAGFCNDTMRVSALDAADFVRAWEGRLIVPADQPWLYRSPKSAASEMFFWPGRKQPTPRKFTLWLEPVITVAALARLHFDFGWPSPLLGTQSPDYAFDLVVFSPDGDGPCVLGEVKKTTKEVDVLIEFMDKFGRVPDAPAPPGGKERNAYKKVVELRNSGAPVFWAVGPGGFSKAFHVKRIGAAIELVAADESALHFSNHGGV